MDDPMTKHLAKLSEYAEQFRYRLSNKRISAKLLEPVKHYKD